MPELAGKSSSVWLQLVLLIVNLLGFPGQNCIGGTTVSMPAVQEHEQGRKKHMGANE